MSTTCARKGCRKKATYELTLARYDGANPLVAALQGWSLCLDDRDAVQAAIGAVLDRRVEMKVTKSEYERQMREWRPEQVDAGQVTNTPEPESTPVTHEAPVAPAPGGRPVARPAN